MVGKWKENESHAAGGKAVSVGAINDEQIMGVIVNEETTSTIKPRSDAF